MTGSLPETLEPIGAAAGAHAAGGSISQAGELRSTRIEALRALAALAVLEAHVYGTAHAYGPDIYRSFVGRILLGGGFGVYLFFGLSGYLLFWPFVRRDFGGGGELDLRRYAINRALRILPLYYVVMIVLLLTQEHGGSTTQWLHFLTWTENFSTHTVLTVDGPAWSLVVELHFYILLPFVALLLRRLSRGSPTRAVAILVALAGVSVLFREVTLAWTHSSPLWRYALPDTFFLFVGGMLVAFLRLSWEATPPSLLRGWLGRSDTWLLGSGLLWLGVFWRYHWILLVPVASFLTVSAAVLPLRSGALLKLLDWRPLSVLGLASYSLYLWHVPLIYWLVGSQPVTYGYAGLLVRVLPLACAVALASYAVIEAPFLSLRRRWSSVTPPILATEPPT